MSTRAFYRRRARTMNLATTARGAIAGVSGNSPFFGGQMATGEYLKTLDGQKGRLVYDEMRRSDNQVGAVLKQITLPILANKYRVDAQKDPATGKADPKDEEIAGIIQERLFNGMTSTWQDTVRHALLMLPFGFSIQEKIWERDADGLIMPKELAPRLPQSVIRWDVDLSTHELVGPVQLDTDGHEYHLPMEKLLVFTTDREGDNWEGISILRTAYKPWYIKDQLEKINAIKHDRFGVGVPRTKVPPSVTKDTQQYKDTVAMLEAFYANEQGWIVEPEGYTTDILGATGQGTAGVDALPSIKYYDECIARACMAMFIMLGQTQSGSRALGQTFYDAFTLSIQAFADYVAEVYNRFLIPEWVDYNWEVDRYPKLCADKITDIDFQALAQLITAKAITPNVDLENSLRGRLNLPEIEEDETGAAPTSGVPTGSSPEGAPQDGAPPVDEAQPENMPGGGTTPDPAVGVAASDRRGRHMHFIDKSALTPEELIPNLDGIQMRLNDASVNLDKTLLQMRDKQAEYLAQQFVGGRSLPNINVPMKKDMFDAMRSTYTEQMRAGKQDVVDEALKQRPKLKLADPVDPKKKKPTSQQRAELDTERMMLDVDGATSKLKSSMAQWVIDLKQSGLQGADLRAALMDRYNAMPTSTWDTMADGATNRGWGTGRQAGLESIASEIDRCYYSAILDFALCSECRDTWGSPGSQDHAVDDPNFTTPNPNCLGNGRCRCMTIAVLKAETESVPPGAGFGETNGGGN